MSWSDISSRAEPSFYLFRVLLALALTPLGSWSAAHIPRARHPHPPPLPFPLFDLPLLLSTSLVLPTAFLVVPPLTECPLLDVRARRILSYVRLTTISNPLSLSIYALALLCDDHPDGDLFET